MEAKPCILILSNTNTKPQSLLKLISKSTSIDEDSPGKVKCNWFIDSKYYTADVCLMGLERDFERSEDFNGRVEALIVHVDTNRKTGLKDLSAWDKIYQDCDPEVKLLVANYCNEDTKITKEKAIEWCLEKGYEFIELYPTCINDDNIASNFEEKVGVERIIEALYSHTWSNLKMKSQHKKGTLNNECPKEMNREKLDGSISDDSCDDFTELFSQLQTMRESLNSLPSTQRKQCAEQMVTAFWKAIGGDEEELSDS
ncbi:alpha- and gamma-adaptin-binding protein p34-like [Coccinella septempunctata]|uniref:alpha- and gamma-adaptin-binding protein p34-like n=1 Tax=Coccinella septempunctata TaxID=41139 RepID=UPI001D07911D|nr:alpha- and gamma-adaptin-binding protein p34-like [Coccinella septempunctata]